MPTYYITFGQKYRDEPHPVNPAAHPDAYACVSAPTFDAARRQAFELFGPHWANIYDADDFEPDLYPRGEL